MILFKVYYKVYLNISIPGLCLLLWYQNILYTASVVKYLNKLDTRTNLFKFNGQKVRRCLACLQNYELYENIRRIK